MTIIEAINTIDAMKPNSYEQTEKIKWLSTLDGRIKREIIDTHEGADAVVFNEYNSSTPLDTELLVPAPYDEVYIKYLEAMIDNANNEYAKYNNSSVMFNNAYIEYWRYYNRNHLPISGKRKYF